MSKKTGFTITLEDKELNQQLEAGIKRNPEEATKAVKDCLLDLAGESSRRAPIESGALRNDCLATLNGLRIFAKRVATGSAIATQTPQGEVSYGLPYALKQHEDLSLSHTRTEGHTRADGTTVNMVAGGEAKYLERPFEERRARYIKRLQRIPEDTIK